MTKLSPSMKTFVVYEVWTKAKIIQASTFRDAYEKGCPDTVPNGNELNLCNWHIVAVDGTQESDEAR
jgi:hypothetical protein